MESKSIYVLPDDKITFCLKSLKSFKTSRLFSPIVYLLINCLFIFALLGFDNYPRDLIVYILLCLLTTCASYFITTKAIKRYSNIVVSISFFESNSFEITTLLDKKHSINSKEYSKDEGVLAESRNEKFNTYIILYNEQAFTLIPEWFEGNNELKSFLMLPK